MADIIASGALEHQVLWVVYAVFNFLTFLIHHFSPLASYNLRPPAVASVVLGFNCNEPATNSTISQPPQTQNDRSDRA